MAGYGVASKDVEDGDAEGIDVVREKDWTKFCKHMRAAIKDEKDAVPDYMKLIKEADAIITGGTTHDVGSVVKDIIEDEKRHRKELIQLFDQYCPRMAFHRKGID